MDGVRQGKVTKVDLSATDAAAARASVMAMRGRRLANTVIETYTIASV